LLAALLNVSLDKAAFFRARNFLFGDGCPELKPLRTNLFIGTLSALSCDLADLLIEEFN
jgi:hypothetical protein